MVIYEIRFKRDTKDLFENRVYIVKKYKNRKYYLENKKTVYEHEINCFDYPQYYNYVLSERDIEPMKIAILKKVQSVIKDENRILDEVKNILKALENEEEK